MIAPARAVSSRADLALLAAVAAGDRRALETLYLDYHRRLARFLRRFAAPESIEEIINDTFLAVWQGARDFRGASQASTWIMGIAYRTALKSQRSSRRHDGARLAGVPEPSTEPHAEAEIEDWLRRGFAQLTDEQRLTLELVYQLGHSLEETAAITDSPVGTVKARLFHARAKLRTLLPALAGMAPAPGVEPSSEREPLHD